MKSFLPYLIFSVLLLICYYERKSTCPSPQNALEEPYTTPRLKEESTKNAADDQSFTMNLRINEDLNKGAGHPANPKRDVDLFGVVFSFHFPKIRFEQNGNQ